MSLNNNPFASALTFTDQEFSPLPAGDYEFVVADVELKIYDKQNTKIQYGCGEIVLKLAVKNTNNRSVFEHLYTDPKMTWKIREFAKSVGMFHDGFTAGELQNCKGKSGKMTLEIDNYNGKQRNRVKNFTESTSNLSIASEDLPF